MSAGRQVSGAVCHFCGGDAKWWRTVAWTGASLLTVAVCDRDRAPAEAEA